MTHLSDAAGQQLALTLEFFGGAPGYLAKLVDLVHSHQRKQEAIAEQEYESETVHNERERIEELKVYQLVKALAGAPAWKSHAQAQEFPIDATPLSARFSASRASSSPSPPLASASPLPATTQPVSASRPTSVQSVSSSSPPPSSPSAVSSSSASPTLDEDEDEDEEREGENGDQIEDNVSTPSPTN